MILISIATFIIMEMITWLTHKFVMHGFLWTLHEDHHDYKHKHVLEKNDLFFVIFATPSIILSYYGAYYEEYSYLLYIGIGIMAYGFSYFVVHDIIIHQRFKLFTRSTFFYIVAIRKAHKMHHKNQGKEESQCFGMLYVPLKYFREALRNPTN